MKSRDAQTYLSTGGEYVRATDYDRWIDTAAKALALLDPDGYDNEPHERIADLITHLLHFAQREGLDVTAVLETATANYEAERLPEGVTR